MPSNVVNVGFGSPASLIAPDLALQQQQLARQQAIADALRQQAMEGDTRVAPGSRMSDSQGMAKVLAAVLAKGKQKKIDEQSLDLNQKYGQALRGKFYGDQPSPQSAPVQAQPLRLPATGQSISLPPPEGQPQQPQQQPQPQGRGDWSLSGNPGQDMSDYMLNPEKYGEAVITAHSPTEVMRNLKAQGLEGPALESAMAQYNAKQSYVPPVTGRPGAIQRDPFTNKIIGVDPQNIEGANPEIVDGRFTGNYTPAGGAAGVKQTMEAAGAYGKAAGQLVDVYDPKSRQMVKIPATAALSGAAGGNAPMAAAPPMGAQAAANVTGTNSANAFQAISDGAADAPNRIYALNQMSNIVADPKTVLGPGSEQWNKVRGTLGTLTGTAAPSTTNAQEFSKWASQYSARSAQELGLSGSDARVQIAVHATPNGEMTKDALRAVIPQMVGLEHAKQGYATAADRWQQTHGPDSVQTFRTEWNKVYNPSIYTHMVQGPQAFAGWVKSLSPQQAAQTRAQYLQLKQLGALPQ